jgi:hypothetical protein
MVEIGQTRPIDPIRPMKYRPRSFRAMAGPPVRRSRVLALDYFLHAEADSACAETGKLPSVGDFAFAWA